MSAGRKHRPAPSQDMYERLLDVLYIAEHRGYTDEVRAIHWTATTRAPDGSTTTTEAEITVGDLRRIARTISGES